MLVMIMGEIDDSKQLWRIDFAVAATWDAPYFGVVANMGESRLIYMLRAGRTEWARTRTMIAQDGLAVHCADLLPIFQPWTNFCHYSSAAGQSP